MLLSLFLILLIKGVFSFCGSNSIASQANLLREVPSMKIFDWKKREAFKTLELPEDYEAKVNTIFPIPGSRKKFHRVGRGISAGQGGSCGRGMKGQNSRSGGGVRLGFEGGQTPLARRFPKVRTMRGHIKKKYELIKFSMLNTMPTGSIIHAADLRATGVLTKPNKGRDQYKVVGGGEALTAKGLTVRAHAFTTSARAAIESLGGQCTVLSPTRKNLPLEEAVEQEEELKRERLEKLKAFRLLKQSTLPKNLLWPKH